MLDSKTMKYQLFDDSVYFSASLFDQESGSVLLAEVKDVFVMDAKPWSCFDLGTVLFILDHQDAAHPCV